MPRDEDSDLHPQPEGTHCCTQERRIRILEKKVEGHDGRLQDGALAMQALELNGKAMSESLDRLHGKVDGLANRPPIAPIVVHAPSAPEQTTAQKIGDAAIHWIVPIVLGALAWAVASSGMIRVGVAP
jgi:hypothetical protein